MVGKHVPLQRKPAKLFERVDRLYGNLSTFFNVYGKFPQGNKRFRRSNQETLEYQEIKVNDHVLAERHFIIKENDGTVVAVIVYYVNKEANPKISIETYAEGSEPVMVAFGEEILGIGNDDAKEESLGLFESMYKVCRYDHEEGLGTMEDDSPSEYTLPVN
jgi:hypothetical protein